MDEILSKVALHTATFVGKAAFAYSTNYAMKQVANYIKNDSAANKIDTSELEQVKASLDVNIRIVQPSIDLIEIISARGNTFIEPAVAQAVQLRKEIDAFAQMVSMDDADINESTSTSGSGTKVVDHTKVLSKMKALDVKIREFVPYLNLVLTTSGANLGVSLRNHVSPSLLLQASAALNEAHKEFTREKLQKVCVGPLFKLRLYYLFAGNFRPKTIGDFTWKEEFTKCDGEIVRVRQNSSEGKKQFLYELVLTEDLNDGRYHEEFDTNEEIRAKLEKNEKIPGKVLRISVSEISRLFYNSSGSMLNIEDSRTPVLVLKVVKGLYKKNRYNQDTVNNKESDSENNDQLYIPPVAVTPDKHKFETSETAKVECYGLELFQEPEFSFEEGEEEDEVDSQASDSDEEPSLGMAINTPLPLNDDDISSDATISEDETISDTERNNEGHKQSLTEFQVDQKPISEGKESDSFPVENKMLSTNDSNNYRNTINTLSFLEYIIRLSALEMSEQKQHSEVNDEKINLFLKDDDASSTAGASSGGVNATSTSDSSTSPNSPKRKSPTKQRSSPKGNRSLKANRNQLVESEFQTPFSSPLPRYIDETKMDKFPDTLNSPSKGSYHINTSSTAPKFTPFGRGAKPSRGVSHTPNKDISQVSASTTPTSSFGRTAKPLRGTPTNRVLFPLKNKHVDDDADGDDENSSASELAKCEHILDQQLANLTIKDSNDFNSSKE
ncbi:5605_t:CDS:2 [Ambispora leptoticha]|uniref:5605_t:CDS:1 n=1 Tax=Ambispora leptoticha TaxID=144679 RepID=A0A9N9A6C4_9GLOM|nr:5605_t:CDS:2 [Ambispora leptoticha]